MGIANIYISVQSIINDKRGFCVNISEKGIQSKIYKTCPKKTRQNNPLSRDKAIIRTRFRNDPNVGTIR